MHGPRILEVDGIHAWQIEEMSHKHEMHHRESENLRQELVSRAEQLEQLLHERDEGLFQPLLTQALFETDFPFFRFLFYI